MLVERCGYKVYPVETGKNNIKITTPEDIDFAEYLLKKTSVPEYRTGCGYDVHRFSEGRKLILGGVDIPFEKGLLGHSDADVLVHAIMDALLGAASLGDIGRHFPDTDESYKGISSLELLRRVNNLIWERGYSVINIDATIVIQRPKIASYIEEMVHNISKTLNIEQGRVNIKATTEEHLGFTGREEGAAAHAIASLLRI
ncbi:MAG: 2-C-methyl-D-erythritol 2,4-cyclodiphosphate synthase [Clostridia bacterium]|nr:2-C-methyl-D-erythritol 2,4-cyclodiphosphate synthase [Clostridia bacterium]